MNFVLGCDASVRVCVVPAIAIFRDSFPVLVAELAEKISYVVLVASQEPTDVGPALDIGQDALDEGPVPSLVRDIGAPAEHALAIGGLDHPPDHLLRVELRRVGGLEDEVESVVGGGADGLVVAPMVVEDDVDSAAVVGVPEGAAHHVDELRHGVAVGGPGKHEHGPVEARADRSKHGDRGNMLVVLHSIDGVILAHPGRGPRGEYLQGALIEVHHRGPGLDPSKVPGELLPLLMQSLKLLLWQSLAGRWHEVLDAGVFVEDS